MGEGRGVVDINMGGVGEWWTSTWVGWVGIYKMLTE